MNEQQTESLINGARARLGEHVEQGSLMCISLITGAAKDQGIRCPALTNARRTRNTHGPFTVTHAIKKDLAPIDRSEARAGDVLLFHLSGFSRVEEHLALVTSDQPLTIIHPALIPSPAVVEHELEGSFWSMFVVGAFRFR